MSLLKRLVMEVKGLVREVIINWPDSPYGCLMRKWYWCKSKNIPTTAYIQRGARISGVGSLHIGENFVLGEGSIISIGFCSGLFIGNNVAIAAQSHIRTGNHAYSDTETPIQQQGHFSECVEHLGKTYSIVIENDVWIGIGSVLLSGCHLKKGSILTPNSVCAHVVPSMSIATGNPARVFSKRGYTKD